MRPPFFRPRRAAGRTPALLPGGEGGRRGESRPAPWAVSWLFSQERSCPYPLTASCPDKGGCAPSRRSGAPSSAPIGAAPGAQAGEEGGACAAQVPPGAERMRAPIVAATTERSEGAAIGAGGMRRAQKRRSARSAAGAGARLAAP